MNNKNSSLAIAVGGLSSALCLVIMLMTGMIPFATYALPIIAGAALLPCAVELGLKTASTAYACVGILALFVVPDKEAAMMFVAFFGYYPILRFKLQKMHSKVLRTVVKFVIFNATMVAAYVIIIYVFGMTYILEESGAGWLLAATLALGNVCFAAYDWALAKWLLSYIFIFRKRITKSQL